MADDLYDIKCYEVAYNFVNVCAGSKTEAYRRYYLEHNEEPPASIVKCASQFFKNKKVQKYVEELQAENREKYNSLRDENIAILKSISVDLLSSNRDKIAAIKTLNQMCGFETQNISITAKDLEISIED